MVKVAVVFQSGKGHTKALADSVLKGLESVEGVNGCLLEIIGSDVKDGRFANEDLMSVLDSCDGIVFGCATYMGSASAIFKAFSKGPSSRVGSSNAGRIRLLPASRTLLLRMATSSRRCSSYRYSPCRWE